MGHTPFGYKIENGNALIDTNAAKIINAVYDNYLLGMSLVAAAKKAGLTLSHCGVKGLLQNKHYLGDDFYPRIISSEKFNAAASELEKRASRLGRLNRRQEETPEAPVCEFILLPLEKRLDDPIKNAQYVYSRIMEVTVNGSK